MKWLKKYWTKSLAGLALLIIAWSFFLGFINSQTFVSFVAALWATVQILKNA